MLCVSIYIQNIYVHVCLVNRREIVTPFITFYSKLQLNMSNLL